MRWDLKREEPWSGAGYAGGSRDGPLTRETRVRHGAVNNFHEVHAFMLDMFLLGGAAFGGGIMNAVAGGGSFLTFPALVYIGVPSVIANASSTVALFPGSFASAWAYRKDFSNVDGVPFAGMLGTSLAGGVTGALLLLFTPQKMFDVIIPWLLALATLVFTFGPQLAPRLRKFYKIGPKTVLAGQYLVSIYGGYFGGAVGILLLALYSLFGMSDIRTMNATKTLLTGFMNSVAVVCFIIAGKILWRPTLIMLICAVIGGYVGARYARNAKPAYIRFAIILISTVMTLLFFQRA